MERKLDDWLSNYVRLTDNSEPCQLYREWVGVSVIASVLQRKCYIEWDKMIFPNFYVILVGPSGVRKGTAMNQGYRFLVRPEMNTKLAAESITREALIRRLKKHEVTPPSPEPGGKPMAHSSITVYSEEFAVFIGQNNLEFISNLTDWFDCKTPWRYETVSRGDDTINGIWVNLLGATTPAIIKNVLPQDAIGGGLTSRVIFVYAAKKGKTVAIPVRSEEQQAFESLLARDLEAISLLTGEFIPSQEYIDHYITWYEHSDKNPPFQDEKFGGYNDRRSMHLRKLSMIMCASRTNTKRMILQDFENALDLLQRTERLMPKVFSGYGRLDTSALIDSIGAVLATRKAITEVDLLRMYHKDITREELTEILSVLQEMGFCDIIVKPGLSKTIVYKEEENESGN